MEEKKKDEQTPEEQTPTPEEQKPEEQTPPEEKSVSYAAFEEFKKAYEEREKALREKYENELKVQKEINISLIKGVDDKGNADEEETKSQKFLNALNERRSKKYI